MRYDRRLCHRLHDNVRSQYASSRGRNRLRRERRHFADRPAGRLYGRFAGRPFWPQACDDGLRVTAFVVDHARFLDDHACQFDPAALRPHGRSFGDL